MRIGIDWRFGLDVESRPVARRLAEEGLKVTWTCNSRVDYVDEEMLRLMGRAGCMLISWGIESGNELILKKYYNIGFACDTPDGLVVPVIRDVNQKDVLDIARELGELSAKARERKLKVEEMQGGCFTISSLGGIGGTSFTPIINCPEVAILGVSRSSFEPVWNAKTKSFEPRLMLPLSLSYDHRVIDGADGARFTSHLRVMLSDVRRLLL